MTFSEPVAPGSVTASSVRLRADGAGSDVRVARSVAGATVTLDPSADLEPFTSYTATVTTAVMDHFGNALAATSAWSFTTGGITTGFIDTTVADFGLGTTGADTAVSDTSGGEVILAPTVGAEFGGSSLPGGWSAKGTPWATGGTASVAGGNLSVDGTMAATDGHVRPRPLSGVRRDLLRSVRPACRLRCKPRLRRPMGDHQHRQRGRWVFARTTNSPGGVSLGSALLGSSHRYRIDWTATGFDFFVDGGLVTTIPFIPAGPMLVGVSDFNAGTALVVDWIRTTPYASSGTFVSRIFDAGSSHDWTTLADITMASAGTSANFETRTGNVSVPDLSWSAWQAVAGSVITSPDARYAQYRVTWRPPTRPGRPSSSESS